MKKLILLLSLGVAVIQGMERSATPELPTPHAQLDHATRQQQSFWCDLCSKQYATKESLERHKKLHKGVRYPCNDCKYKATDISNLKRHRRTWHSQRTEPEAGIADFLPPLEVSSIAVQLDATDSEKIKCPHCGKMVKQFKQHWLTHTGEKKYTCKDPGCLAQFIQKNQLRVHILRHMKLSSFACEELGCDREFKTKGDYHIHLREIHKVLKYPCGVCGLLFEDKKERARHEFSHTKTSKRKSMEEILTAKRIHTLEVPDMEGAIMFLTASPSEGEFCSEGLLL